MTPENPLTLADYRRTVAEMYAAVRRSTMHDPLQTWRLWCMVRDNLFRSHPQSALSAEQRANFTGLRYFDYDPSWALIGRIDRNVAHESHSIDLGADGSIHYTRIARVHFERGDMYSLNLYWIDGYGGGLFLPFGDASNGNQTYGGGRYLYDTIKGADLGGGTDQLVLDFNYAYNPSCAYNANWMCPLNLSENILPIGIDAGETTYT